MSEFVPVDLAATGGQLLPPGSFAAVPELPKPAADPAPAPPPQAAAKSADPVPENCRHCGWPTKVDPVEPDDGDALRFVAAVWRGVPYTKQVDLFGDAVTLVMRWLTADEEEATYAKLEAEKAAGMYAEPFPVGQVRASDRLADLRFGYAVERLRVGERVWERPAETVDDPDAVAGRIRAVCGSAPVWDAVRWEYRMFMTQLARLRANARNPSFYRATPAGGPSPVPPPPATPASPPRRAPAQVRTVN